MEQSRAAVWTCLLGAGLALGKCPVFLNPELVFTDTVKYIHSSDEISPTCLPVNTWCGLSPQTLSEYEHVHTIAEKKKLFACLATVCVVCVVTAVVEVGKVKICLTLTPAVLKFVGTSIHC